MYIFSLSRTLDLAPCLKWFLLESLERRHAWAIPVENETKNKLWRPYTSIYSRTSKTFIKTCYNRTRIPSSGSVSKISKLHLNLILCWKLIQQHSVISHCTITAVFDISWKMLRWETDASYLESISCLDQVLCLIECTIKIDILQIEPSTIVSNPKTSQLLLKDVVVKSKFGNGLMLESLRKFQL